MSTVDILIEVGAEEIPHRFLPDAIAELRSRFEGLFREAGLSVGTLGATGGPRRLAVLAKGVAERQSDRTETLVGPPAAAAFKDGAPTPAAAGFAKKCGVDVSALTRVTEGGVERIAATRHVTGSTAAEVVAAAAPKLIEGMPWPKNMRWADGKPVWVRPVHWVVALAGNHVIDFEIFGVRTGRHSRGHRVKAPGEVAILSASSYGDALRAAGLLADRDEKRRSIEAQLAAKAAEAGGELLADPGNVDATTDLVEMPVVVIGRFPERYLELPDVVLSTAMRVHQKFFALQGRDGRLLPAFLHVANQPDPHGTIAANNGNVLIARLDDARFFWAADIERSLESRVPALERVLFQEKLGTYMEKVRRMETLAARAVALSGGDAGLARDVARAVLLSKVDQTTDMVKEFTELQGVMGGLYLRREGEAEAVWRAVEEHYLPQALTDPVPRTRAGALLSVVDKADTLAGCFGVGVIPTGSKDPFGLRRAAQGLVRTLLEAPLPIPVSALLEAAADGFAATPGFDRDKALSELRTFLEARLRFLLTEGVPLSDEGGTFPADEVAAAIGAGWDRLPDLLARLRALHGARRQAQDDFAALSVAFKRVRNIVKGQPRGKVDAARLAEPAEAALAEKLAGVSAAARPLMEDGRYLEAMSRLATLRPEVDAFFDEVMVMAEDPALRANRVALLQSIESLFLQVADIGEITQ